MQKHSSEFSLSLSLSVSLFLCRTETKRRGEQAEATASRLEVERREGKKVELFSGKSFLSLSRFSVIGETAGLPTCVGDDTFGSRTQVNDGSSLSRCGM